MKNKIKKVEIYIEDCKAESNFNKYEYKQKTAKIIFEDCFMSVGGYFAYLFNEKLISGVEYKDMIKKATKYIKSDKIEELTNLICG